METLSKKICMLGDFAVGKTSLVHRFVYDAFSDRYMSTIGVKVSRKPLMINRGGRMIDLTMILWDLAGSEEFDQMRGAYLRGASGALLVYDLTRSETLASVSTYMTQLRQVNRETALVLVGNKLDLAANDDARLEQAVQEGMALAAQLGAPLVVASALTGEAVEDAFRQLGQLLVR